MSIQVNKRTDDRPCPKCQGVFEYSNDNNSWSCFCAVYQGQTHPLDKDEPEDDITLDDVAVLLAGFKMTMDAIEKGVGTVLERLDKLEQVIKES